MLLTDLAKPYMSIKVPMQVDMTPSRVEKGNLRHYARTRQDR